MFNWICPLCEHSLIANETGWQCANNHHFDRAKSGYVNLLPPQHKHSKDPGDSKAMLLARRDFLNGGYYAPIAEAILSAVNSLPATEKNHQNIRLLDCGCGEGYYLQAISAGLADNWTLAGVDISKNAIDMAARRQIPRSTWVCASSLRLPLADESVDVALRIFSPKNDDELYRVLRHNGVMLVVTPAKNHLIELRSQLYSQLKPYQIPIPPTGFTALWEETVTNTLMLRNNDAIKQLLSMTPFFWNGQKEAREKLMQQSQLDVSVEVLISCFGKII